MKGVIRVAFEHILSCKLQKRIGNMFFQLTRSSPFGVRSTAFCWETGEVLYIEVVALSRNEFPS